jgi:hypothetical protein
MKTNVKFRVETDEENQQVFYYIKEQSEKEDFAWAVFLDGGGDYFFDSQDFDDPLAFCSVWKGFRYFAVDIYNDLILCISEEEYNKRHEKEITFEEFIGEVKR